MSSWYPVLLRLVLPFLRPFVSRVLNFSSFAWSHSRSMFFQKVFNDAVQWNYRQREEGTRVYVLHVQQIEFHTVAEATIYLAHDRRVIVATLYMEIQLCLEFVLLAADVTQVVAAIKLLPFNVHSQGLHWNICRICRTPSRAPASSCLSWSFRFYPCPDSLLSRLSWRMILSFRRRSSFFFSWLNVYFYPAKRRSSMCTLRYRVSRLIWIHDVYKVRERDIKQHSSVATSNTLGGKRSKDFLMKSGVHQVITFASHCSWSCSLIGYNYGRNITAHPRCKYLSLLHSFSPTDINIIKLFMFILFPLFCDVGCLIYYYFSLCLIPRKFVNIRLFGKSVRISQ